MSGRQIPTKIREAVWRTYYGADYEHPCFICQRMLTIDSFDCGHVIPHANGGPATIENLRPICKQCNGEMRTVDMRIFAHDRRKLLPTPIAHNWLTTTNHNEKPKTRKSSNQALVDDLIDDLTNRMVKLTIDTEAKYPPLTELKLVELRELAKTQPAEGFGDQSRIS